MARFASPRLPFPSHAGCYQLREAMKQGAAAVSQYHNYPDSESEGHVTFDDKPELNAAIKEEQANFRKTKWGKCRKDCGAQLYGAIGVSMKDTAGKLKQLENNADFFGAPVGLLITIDRVFERPQWGNVGMFLGLLGLLAEEAGLSTCYQGYMGVYGQVIWALHSLFQYICMG